MFQKREKSHIESIVRLQLERVSKRLLDRGLKVTFDDKAISFLADKGFQPEFGARPVKRCINENILDNLSLKIIDGTVSKSAPIYVVMTNQGLLFENR